MTNKPNNNQPENECIRCSAYSYFLTLAKTTDIEEAFHDAMDFVVEHAVENIEMVAMESFEDGYRDGYLEAFKSISEQMIKTTEMLEEMTSDSPCDDCDCAEGYCEAEDDGTDYKFTFKDETVEDKIRNAIRED